MKKNDVIFIVSALIFAVILTVFLGKKTDFDSVIIEKNGHFYAEKPLDTDCTVKVGGNTVCIRDGEVYMEHADCPDKLCIKQGKISDSSKKIICLPNRVTVEITKKSEIDTVVR